MTPGEIAVLLVLAGAMALAVRSLWKSRKSGGCCGDCASCRRCRGKRPGPDV